MATTRSQSARAGAGLAWFADAWKLPAEDAVEVAAPDRKGGLHIVCLCLSRIANFDDLDPLAQESGVRLAMLGPGRTIPGDADLVILPGTKSTRGDLAFLRAQGWGIDLMAHVRRGGHVLGICGGYQMLVHSVSDPHGIEGAAGEDGGLGLLDMPLCQRSCPPLYFSSISQVGGIGRWFGILTGTQGGYAEADAAAEHYCHSAAVAGGRDL